MVILAISDTSMLGHAMHEQMTECEAFVCGGGDEQREYVRYRQAAAGVQRQGESGSLSVPVVNACGVKPVHGHVVTSQPITTPAAKPSSEDDLRN